ncbi:HK97 gp10 family phage protein [Bacillus thuringiensis]|uniref:HK97 gp10 family phage protein n=1 Tax=Bacillus thuringiensis TaxID=1428 RepID=UPI000A369938|nr:HK97 gp10 family phage protein [Bacillus thuringiensis]MEB9538045.1 HK97 gp10 family phage protein [Bacillus cereus]MDR5022546.1 HK97 gp10 family phage protein [Bacillus thuringiensis]MED2123638.1 HK97 gp10 family phage protein [Bacillus thuringiensis]MED2146143.1 HK97 gp10 family phage protein [Bacillus thuringiensis]MED2170687.1 HK97 gp10 family phage protein [Bacillus thuringiensis]
MNDFAGELARELQRYANVVEEELLTVQEEVADVAVEKLKQNSPKKTGAYRKGWRKKKVDKAVVIHNTKGQLTHLLENGHAKAGGGRVPEKVHIRPVEEYVIDELPKRIERAIES